MVLAGEESGMREPTQQEVAKFKRACKALDELGKIGFRMYLANDTMNLMTDAPHKDSGTPNRDAVKAESSIDGASGGDW